MPTKFAKRLGVVALAAGAAVVLCTSLVNAATLAGLQDGSAIVWIDMDAKKVVGSVKIDGGARLVGIDVRPADNKLYGVTTDGAIVVIDAKTGKWEKKSQLSEPLHAGAEITIDFNPVADRLRILTSTGISLRVNVDDGKAVVDGTLKYAEADAMKGKVPKVTAAGYSNSIAGTKETALYDIDATAGTLTKQAPPNDGILTTIGSLGVKLDGPIAFDIWTDGKGTSVGWLLVGGSLHKVDLATAKTTSVGAVTGLSGRITDIAILPGT